MPAPKTANITASDTIQVARQAILDRNMNLYGYELLYRNASGNSEFVDGNQASSATILNAFMEIGLDRIIGPHKAFINLTRQFFVDIPPIPLPADRIVLEILENTEVDEALLNGLDQMKALGFSVAIDDYAFQANLQPLLDRVHIIKVEIHNDSLATISSRMAELKASGAVLLAEKVETAEQFRLLCDMGFDLFQGYFFARPHLIRTNRVPESASMLVQLLGRLNDPTVPIGEVVKLISQDPGLSFKILRYVNSAANGLATSIDSIQRAVILMGLQRIRAWATLFSLSGLKGRPAELLNMAVFRANLCERLARLCGIGAPDVAYTVGLLSIVDAMFGRPMNELLEELPLPEEIRIALTSNEGTYGKLLSNAAALEQAKKPHDICGNLSAAALQEAYAASTDAAFDLLAQLQQN